MADTKITALSAITTVDPANDVLPIVDVSDTSMAASGTTKKITTNQILGASGTATLASATITGDLTVDTSTLKVDSANNRVGIGTATPATPLNIGTAVSRHFLANGQTTGSSYGEITTTGADAIYGAVDAAAGLFTNAIANASFFGSGNATSLQLVTNSTSRYEISSTGVATWSNVGGVAGTAMTLNSTGLGVGVTPTAGRGAVQLSAGVGFPATQVASTDPNTLDDYEEGTWTGTLAGATTNPTTPVTATGLYTKIGRQVSIQIQFTNVDTTGASGQIKVTGAPFTNNSSVSSTGAVLLSSMGTFTGSPAAFIGVSTTEIELYASSSGGAAGLVTHNAGASRSLYINLTYTV